MISRTYIDTINTLGEFLVAWVIYYELENSRLDKFLDDISQHHAEYSRIIYEAFCGLDQNPDLARRKHAFSELLDLDTKLRDACNSEIALLNRLGTRLPRLWFLRNKVLDFSPHSLVFLLDILWDHLLRRRRETAALYGTNFMKFGAACAKRVLKSMSKKDIGPLVLRDPTNRHADIHYSEEFIRALVAKVRDELSH